MKEIDVYGKGRAEVARRAAVKHMQALYNSMDQMLCSDIMCEGRYTIQRHDIWELLIISSPVRFTQLCKCIWRNALYWQK